jgi:hypothetical protein
MNKIQDPLGPTLIARKHILGILAKCTPFAHSLLLNTKLWKTYNNPLRIGKAL